MHVEFSQQAQHWGGWVLGDLAVAVCRAVEVVGPSTNVIAVRVASPGNGAPRVVLVVPDAEEVARLREEAGSGEYPVRFVGRVDELGWEAETHGIRLAVAVAREES